MDVCVLIPTLNEEKGIKKTIDSVPKKYDIIVIDGHSDDRTVEIVKKCGVKIIFCKKKGKGSAVRKAFKELDYDIFVLIDGDFTYNGADIPSLVGKVIEGHDLVIGSRFKQGIKNMKFSRKTGNIMLAKTFNFLNKSDFTDITSGLRAMSKRFVKSVDFVSDGFNIETEMNLRAVRQGFKFSEVPIKYMEREGQSKLNFLDMARIYLFTLRMTENE